MKIKSTEKYVNANSQPLLCFKNANPIFRKVSNFLKCDKTS